MDELNNNVTTEQTPSDNTRPVVEPINGISNYAENAGFEGSVIVDKILRSKKIGYGFDAAKEVYTDMMEAGIVDPTKVSRSALQNAASIASVVLTTEALVADKKEPKGCNCSAPAPDMGGMGGMY